MSGEEETQQVSPEVEKLNRRMQKVEDVHKQVRLQFDEMILMVKSLKPNPVPLGYATFSNQKLLADLNACVAASKEKDEIIKQKENQINSMGNTMTEKIERDELKKLVDQLTIEMRTETARASTMPSDSQKQKQIKELKEKLKGFASELEEKKEKVRQQEEQNKLKRKKLIENDIDNYSNKIIEIKEETSILKEQLDSFKQENEKLRAEKGITVDESQLNEAQKEIKGQLRDTIQQMVKGTYSMLNENVDEDTDYSGTKVRMAVKNVLNAQAQKILSPDDEDEEEEENEGQANGQDDDDEYEEED